jgi:outer membrane receptor protein involved in Fe transport
VGVWGLEAEVDVRVWVLRSFANYTFTWSRDAAGDPVPEIAEHVANVGIAADITPRIRVDVRGSYLGERETLQPNAETGETMLEDAFVLNGTLSFLDFGGFDFQLLVKNALDAEYYHPSHRPPVRYRQPQRTVLVKGVYRF